VKNKNRILVWESEGKRSLVRPTRRWEESIKMDVKGMGYKGYVGFIWIELGSSNRLLSAL
jgi:hypothetical protein